MGTKVNVLGLFRVTPHRLLHFSAFGLLAIIVGLAGRRPQNRVIGSLGAISLGISIEILQFLWSTKKRFELADVRDDAIAVLVGYLLVESYLFATNASRKTLQSGS